LIFNFYFKNNLFYIIKKINYFNFLFIEKNKNLIKL